MNPEFPSDFLRRLITIGEANDFGSLANLFAEFPPQSVGHLMRQRPEYWYAITNSLSENDHETLVRAITVAEQNFPSFSGGSVTGTIWAFRRLQERTGSHLDTLADWMLAHTKNPWVPYGTNNHGARSLAELQTFQEHAATIRTEKARKENTRQAEDAIRTAHKATHDLFAAIRRKDFKAVQALLLRGARVDVENNEGQNALGYAQALGQTAMIALLQAHMDAVPLGDD